MTKEKRREINKNILIILALIVFFPLGLFLMWKKTNWNESVKWVVTVIGIVLVLRWMAALSASSGSQTSSSDTNASVASTDVPTVAVTNVPMSLTDKIKASLPDDLKSSDVKVYDADQIVDGQATDNPIPGKKTIIITEKQGEGFWDTNQAKEGGWMAMADVSKAVFPVDNSIYSVTLDVTAPATNAYGKNENVMLEVMTFTRDTYNKIDFNNFDFKNVPTIADIYTENNTLK